MSTGVGTTQKQLRCKGWVARTHPSLVAQELVAVRRRLREMRRARDRFIAHTKALADRVAELTAENERLRAVSLPVEEQQ